MGQAHRRRRNGTRTEACRRDTGRAPSDRLDLANALADSVALGFGEGGSDRQEQLGHTIARDVAAEIEQVELDAPRLQAFDDLKRVERRAEQAIELRGDDNVAALSVSAIFSWSLR